MLAEDNISSAHMKRVLGMQNTKQHACTVHAAWRYQYDSFDCIFIVLICLR